MTARFPRQLHFPRRWWRFRSCCLSQLSHQVQPSPASTPVNTGRLSQDWRSEAGLSEHIDSGPLAPSNKRRESYAPGYIDSIQLPRREDIPGGHVAVNRSGHRLDNYIPPISLETEFRFKDRFASQRLCNSMHLVGSCNNPRCEYDHKQLDEDLKPALEALARSMPCPRRGNLS